MARRVEHARRLRQLEHPGHRVAVGRQCGHRLVPDDRHAGVGDHDRRRVAGLCHRSHLVDDGDYLRKIAGVHQIVQPVPRDHRPDGRVGVPAPQLDGPLGPAPGLRVVRLPPGQRDEHGARHARLDAPRGEPGRSLRHLVQERDPAVHRDQLALAHVREDHGRPGQEHADRVALRSERHERLLEVAPTLGVSPPHPADAAPEEEPGLLGEERGRDVVEPLLQGLTPALRQQALRVAIDQLGEPLPVHGIAQQLRGRFDAAGDVEEAGRRAADVGHGLGAVDPQRVRYEELAEEGMVLIGGLPVVRLLVREVILLVERRQDLPGGRPAGQRSRHRCSHSRQECGLEQHLLDGGISVLEDLRREVIEHDFGRCWIRTRRPALGAGLLEPQHETGGPAVDRFVERADRLPRPSPAGQHPDQPGHLRRREPEIGPVEDVDRPPGPVTGEGGRRLAPADDDDASVPGNLAERLADDLL